jgi:hypothetical protein
VRTSLRFSSLLTGTKTGNFAHSAGAILSNAALKSALARKLSFRDQSQQGMIRDNEDLGFPVTQECGQVPRLSLCSTEHLVHADLLHISKVSKQ